MPTTFRIILAASLLSVAALAPAAAAPRRPDPATRPAAADLPPLTDYSSKHYVVHTNVTRAEAQPIGAHMDAVFEEYQRRFSAFTPRVHKPMDLYLFRTRDQYLAYLDKHDIEGKNSGGMFVFHKGVQGLLTWVQGKSRADMFTTLQHEGFHQFAFAYIGPNLPVWVNEGLAQYFEDGILVSGKMVLEMRPDTRLAAVQTAIRERSAADLDKLLAITDDEWSKLLADEPQQAARNYDQAWSLVYFLVHGDAGKYRPAFEQFLVLLNRGAAAPKAFRQAFGREDISPLRKRWEEYTLGLEPDDISTSLRRMEFLGQGLAFLEERRAKMPATIDQLREVLQRVEFRVTFHSGGQRFEYNALDDAMYHFPLAKTRDPKGGTFELLEAAKADLPPRITARGLRVQPTVIWSRDPDGQLVQDVEYK